MVGDKELDTGFRCWSCKEFTTLRARIAELEARIVWLECEAQVNAAPVSEAKAQGVVKWPEADEIMQMAFEEGQPADDASGYCFELEEFDLFIERLMSDVARLNAAPAAPAADAGLVAVEWAKDAEEWGGALNDAGWVFIEQCPETSALLFNNTKGPLRAAIMKYAEIVAASPAAPAAPAADAGLVEALGYQALFDAIAAATSVYANGAVNISVQAFRDALAAHSAKGVV